MAQYPGPCPVEAGRWSVLLPDRKLGHAAKGGPFEEAERISAAQLTGCGQETCHCYARAEAQLSSGSAQQMAPAKHCAGVRELAAQDASNQSEEVCQSRDRGAEAASSAGDRGLVH